MEMPRPSGGKKKNALLSILRPKPCFFWRVESIRIKDLPLLWNDILTTCSQFLYYTKILLLLGIFTGTPPPMLGKTHGENSPSRAPTLATEASAFA
jgi:hypothetical protein